MPNKRFIDREDQKEIISECKDFYVRKDNIPPVWLIYLFAIIVLAVITVVNYISVELILLPDSDPIPLKEIATLLGIVIFMVIVVAIIAIKLIKRIADAVVTTQFLNLLFINSASINNKFILITNKEKVAVYMDRQFDELFECKSEDDNHVEKMIAHKNIAEEDKDKLMDAILNCEELEIPFGESIIRVKPIKRPKSFCVITGI